jgi:hypothetical protein
MLAWLQSKALKLINRNTPEICKNCIWHKSEEANVVPIKKHVRYCDMHLLYTADHDTCSDFHKEKFEASETENATETKEYNLDLNKSLEYENN